MTNKKFFSSGLLDWNEKSNSREMPWKGEKDPYRIWISEIVLQQTRVQQGMAYYERIIAAFPNVKSLAEAPEQSVFKLWEGLGYYSRCRNLIASAKYIHENLNDKFPSEYDDILSLKGIGSYTASAIASFAFNKPYAVLDGNVFRVLSRFFGIETPINTPAGKKYYGELAQSLLDKQNPAIYNQAIMDFGAVVCKPAAPLCGECPLQKKCYAFLNNKVSVLPINEQVIRQKERFFNYLIIEYRQKFYVKERTAKDIWQNLFEFILIETTSLLQVSALLKSEPCREIFETSQFVVFNVSENYFQKLTHQRIFGRFLHIKITRPLKESGNYQLISKAELTTLPFPKFITSYLADKK
jgi:A/G-specific adenine glycosylase